LLRSSNWTVRDERDNTRRPIRVDDICILFSKTVSYREDLTQKYVRALEAHNIEHVLVGSKSFHRREEIGTIRAALRAIEWPDDELSVYAVLRGALFFIPPRRRNLWVTAGLSEPSR
jgi:ATP-dependent exoDNAse (exonuclease V) beta subunit